MTVLGIENEYGISLAGVPGDQTDPGLLSGLVVTSSPDGTVGWDHSSESPLRDARGTHLPRAEAPPDMLTDEALGDHLHHANRLLTNGARFYVDHAHPEYSGPEVRSARDAMVWDFAGDHLAHVAAERASTRLGVEVRLHKNNTDGKGVSYGCHENHLVPREVPFDAIVHHFTSFLVSRVVTSGAGRVGWGRFGEEPGFQLAQRPDFFEARVGLETTVRRPIINTRDEPHADARRWRRLHVITGDALLVPVARWLSIGSSSLVLQAIAEQRVRLPELDAPVAAFTRFSRDLGLREALGWQWRHWEACADVVDHAWLDDAAEVHHAWGELLDDAGRDWTLLIDRVDWAAKRHLFEALAERRGWTGPNQWAHPGLAALDLQWADLAPQRGLALKLRTAGRLRGVPGIDNLDLAVDHATHRAPGDTRAWLRSHLLQRWGSAVAHANWDRITLRTSSGRLTTVDLGEPLAGRSSWAPQLETCRSVDEVVAVLDAELG